MIALIEKNIKNIIRKISLSSDDNEILMHENNLACMFSVPILILGALANFFIRYFIFDLAFKPLFIESLFIVVVALLLLLLLQIDINQKIKSSLIVFFFSSILVYMGTRYHTIIGPAIWTISFITIIIAMLRRSIRILFMIAITIFLLMIYVSLQSYDIVMDKTYPITQLLACVILFIIISVVYRKITNRSITTKVQYKKPYTSEEKLKSTLKSVGDGVITVDRSGRIDFMNPIAEKLTAWKMEDALGKSFNSVFNIINEFTRLKIENPVDKVFETNRIIELDNHTILIAKDGTEIEIEDTASPIRDSEGVTIGAVIVFRDFSDKKEKRDQIEYLSYHDQLSGLYNRRFFEEELKRLNTKRNLPLSVIFADVNGLKTINDAFGHEHGDEVIKKFALVLRNNCRADDIISRTGGDEFVILLPNTNCEDVQSLTSRIKESIQKQKVMNINISVSFGWSTKDNEEQSINYLIKNAEDMMYQKKIFESASKRGAVIKSIMSTLHQKNPEERSHSKRVGFICESIGKAYNLHSDEVEELKIAGMLHDIGKVSIDSTILNKVEPLTNDEWTQLKLHSETGYRLLGTSKEYYNIAEYVLAHHERWDGKGYPRGLEGEDILWKSRIIAIADAYDSMTSDKSYKKGMSEEEAIQEIKKCAGTYFDPEIARVFVEKVLETKW